MRSTRESARSGGVAALRPRLRLEGERRESRGLQGRRPVVLGKPRLPFKPGKEKLRVGQIGPDLGQEDAMLVYIGQHQPVPAGPELVQQLKIGRASWRDKVGLYGEILVGGET